MEKKVMMNTRLAVAAVVLLFGLLLAGQEAAAAGYDDDTTEKAAPAPAPAPAPAADAAEATPPTGKARPSYGRASYSHVKAVDPTRPGAVANEYTRGCSPINKCRG